MSIAAEKMVLAGLLQYGKEYYEQVHTKIDEECFEASLKNDHIPLLRCLLHTAKNYKEVGYSTIMLSAENLELKEVLENQDNIEHLSVLKRNKIQLEDAVAAAKQLGKKRLLRNLSYEMRRMASELESYTGEEPLGDILSKPGDILSKVISQANDEDEPKKIFEDIVDVLQFIRENPCDSIGLPTHMPIYNEIIGKGLRRGNVDVIVARRKVGKSTFAKNVGMYLSTTYDIPCLYIDTEMGKRDQQIRATAEWTNTNLSNVETGKFGNDVIKKMAKIQDLPFYHVRVAGKHFDEIIALCNSWVKRIVGREKDGTVKDCLIIYDYLKLMDEKHKGSMKEYEAVGYALDKLRTFAGVNDVSCLAFTQANRENDVSQSDRISWFASSVVFLEHKTLEEIASDGGPQNGNVKIRFECSRYGGGLEQGDYISCDFDKKTSKMREIDTRFNLAKAKGNHGFDTTDADPDDEDT